MRVWWLCFLLLSPMAHAVTMAQLQQRFSQQPVVRAHFWQTRQIKDLPQPLQSQGEMIIARDKGLLWQQEAPFPMTLILDSSRMVQQVNQQPPTVITRDSNPQLFQFNHLLSALFQADSEALSQNFQLDFQDQGQGRWTLALTPISSPLDKIFNRIVLQGAGWLEQISLDDKQGDKTQIRFSQPDLTPDKLTEDEQRRFAL